MPLLLARYRTAPGRRDEVLAHLARAAEASRAEPGCLAYDVYTAVDDPDGVLLVERYADADAVDAHRAAEHFQRIILGEVVPLLADRQVEQLEG